MLSPDNFIFLNFTFYFQNFCPLIAQLVGVLFTPDQLMSKSAVTHGDFITIFETALSTLLPEPEVLQSSTYISKPNLTKHVFNGEDGDLMTGSEPIIVPMRTHKAKRTCVAA
jgi:hypothetical protein